MKLLQARSCSPSDNVKAQFRKTPKQFLYRNIDIYHYFTISRGPDQNPIDIRFGTEPYYGGYRLYPSSSSGKFEEFLELVAGTGPSEISHFNNPESFVLAYGLINFAPICAQLTMLFYLGSNFDSPSKIACQSSSGQFCFLSSNDYRAWIWRNCDYQSNLSKNHRFSSGVEVPSLLVFNNQSEMENYARLYAKSERLRIWRIDESGQYFDCKL